MRRFSQHPILNGLEAVPGEGCDRRCSTRAGRACATERSESVNYRRKAPSAAFLPSYVKYPLPKGLILTHI